MYNYMKVTMVLILAISGVTTTAITKATQMKTNESCPYVNLYRHAHNKHHLFCKPGEDDLNVFEQYGFTDKNIPRSLNYLQPMMLHESSVIRYVDAEGEFLYLDNGTFANVYLGEMKDGGKPVVIKQFNKDTDFFDVDKEARILMYLEDTGIFPKFYGYIPSGRYANNISMVMEYITNSQSLSSACSDTNMTVYQWVLVLEQLVGSLKTIHSKYVLHNDLHRSNVMIMWNGSNPRVRVIDTGFASFRGGVLQDMSATSLPYYPFFPPESILFESNPSMDIYAVGYIIGKVTKYLKNEDIASVGKSCYQIIPEHRPTADQLLYTLKQLKKKYSYQSEYGYKPSMDGVLTPPERYQNYETAPLPILILSEVSPMPRTQDRNRWLRLEDSYASYVGKYRNNSVIIRLFAYSDFASIRHQAAVTMFADSLGITPHFYGLIIHGEKMSHVGFVQEFVKNGTTLSEAFREKRSLNWTDEYRLRIACQLINAVSLLHDEHILLNNIKSSNILYRDNGTGPLISILNFQQSSDSNGIYFNKTSVYTAPEITEDEDIPTSFPSDVYSLGVVLKKLFQNSNATRAIEAVNMCVHLKHELRPSARRLKKTMCAKLLEYNCPGQC
ncbi:uncharacterized protein LOC126814071 [Patella vulgata]|uniref:uncharacterized protein LOC126814071 n=1 Tax=Patella vulgata TaxID=6465 RepID=UPI0021801ED3|nr:uncharacterized protein LOC126814071 [Patella vulgata]